MVYFNSACEATAKNVCRTFRDFVSTIFNFPVTAHVVRIVLETIICGFIGQLIFIDAKCIEVSMIIIFYYFPLRFSLIITWLTVFRDMSLSIHGGFKTKIIRHLVEYNDFWIGWCNNKSGNEVDLFFWVNNFNVEQSIVCFLMFLDSP